MSGDGKHIARYYLHVQRKYWSLEVRENELIFFNDKECFILRPSLGKLYVEECSISENYLYYENAYKVCLEQDYENNLNIELMIAYVKKS